MSKKIIFHIKGPWKEAWKTSGEKGFKGIRRFLKALPLFWEQLEEWNFVP